ncbi:hypothetical protein RZA67_01395 [Stenotrophomonas sp. C3(2023)]|uniref:hypothetical protein n=1 Tax=Stenotrophomonas sp. C3(2023) TaxID=3080277 RepID=UPI00293C43E2|nr:hypothetical protein [Stenotrophomonas sp. C3(2023)]MDV3467392.1 hypothetical protein [Stenotrophomonas sp. C3(2023)]
MNIQISAVGALLLALAPCAWAALPQQSVDMTGTLRAPGCTVLADNQGLYDYGKINPSLIPVSGSNLTLSVKPAHWTVDCGQASTYIGIKVMDNRAQSSGGAGNANFGLGRIPGNDTSKLGYYTVTLSNPKVDGVAAAVGKGAPGSADVTGAASIVLDTGSVHTWVKTATNKQTPLAGKQFEVDMSVGAVLLNKAAMGGDITSEVPLDGNITLSYTFGL